MKVNNFITSGVFFYTMKKSFRNTGSVRCFNRMDE